MTNSLFETAKPILETLQAHHYQAYFVGGSVRDYLMNKPIHDIDITTSATPDEIEAIFDKTIPIGREHGTINVVYNGEQYEVTTFRAEGDYVDHRRPNEVFFVRNLYEDVKRRDFTMNAIAMDINYQTFDYFEGQKDIKQHIIRTVGNPDARFGEDALRIVRGLRFQSQFGFQLEEATFNAMLHHIRDIKYLSIERIVVELEKLTLGNYVEKSFNNLKLFMTFKYIPFFKHFDLSKFSLTKAMSFTMFIAFLISQQREVNSNITDLKLSNNDKKYIKKLVQLIELIDKIHTKKQLKLFVYDYGKKDILEVLSFLDVLELNQITSISPLILNYESVNEVAKQLPISSRSDMDINGKDILEVTNTTSGPWLKTILREVECAIISGEVCNFKPELKKWVKTRV
ncbi:CCA tRNA nucleotidyltransferase [Staphylococcus edaphicus]|uniref:CCA-adding enzyme n=1 Tax=Staphylococcus edaphicus TaxID=1955013 RepID=A0A2C6VFY6_9STAP|nr:CCA tRNA nucleotidyltransferase [Staphylococcus edaphicus]PHK49221.1 CCA tRNA nucleotidyltransferase [Staphylococcus edaphicus]